MLSLQAHFQLKVITFKYYGLIKDMIVPTELLYTISLFRYHFSLALSKGASQKHHQCVVLETQSGFRRCPLGAHPFPSIPCMKHCKKNETQESQIFVLDLPMSGYMTLRS